MRPWLALFLLATLPAQAETFSAMATITHVTLYPAGASVEREVTVDLPPGQHELLITVLPRLGRNGGGVASALVSGPSDNFAIDLPKNLTLVSQVTRWGEVLDDPVTGLDQQSESELEIAVQESALREIQARIGQIEARAEAARAKARALQAMLSAADLPDDPAALRQLLDMMQSETLAALQSAKSAEAEIVHEKASLEPVQEALDSALTDQKAAEAREAESATLALTVNSTGGKGTILLRNGTFYENGTGWQPKYEVFLTTGEKPGLDFKRAAVISQSSGEDWQDVTLTLSTAEPTKQPRPNDSYLRSYSIAPKPTETAEANEDNDCNPGCGGPVVVPDNPLLSGEMTGQTLQYTFPEQISIRNKTDSLVLALDDLALPAENFVLVTDSYNVGAFLMAKFTNSTSETLLPGDAQVYRDGVLMGDEQLELVLPGQEGELGFGALMEIVVKKGWPDRMEASRGFFVSETERSEGSVTSVENRSSEAWPLVIRAGVPQSVHEGLEITYTADPAETVRDKGDQPGLMEWQTDLQVGATYRVEYAYTMRWPEGMILQYQ